MKAGHKTMERNVLFVSKRNLACLQWVIFKFINHLTIIIDYTETIDSTRSLACAKWMESSSGLKNKYMYFGAFDNYRYGIKAMNPLFINPSIRAHKYTQFERERPFFFIQCQHGEFQDERDCTFYIEVYVLIFYKLVNCNVLNGLQMFLRSDMSQPAEFNRKRNDKLLSCSIQIYIYTSFLTYLIANGWRMCIQEWILRFPANFRSFPSQLLLIVLWWI